MLTLIFRLQPRLLSGYNLRVNMKTFIHLICPYPAVAVHCTCILSCMVKIICQWTKHYQPVHWFRCPCNIWAFAVTDWGETQYESLWRCFHCLKPELSPSLCCPFFFFFFLTLTWPLVHLCHGQQWQLWRSRKTLASKLCIAWFTLDWIYRPRVVLTSSSVCSLLDFQILCRYIIMYTLARLYTFQTHKLLFM